MICLLCAVVWEQNSLVLLLALWNLCVTGFVQVMESLESHLKFKNFIFKAWKVMEFNCRSLKVMQMAKQG